MSPSMRNVIFLGASSLAFLLTLIGILALVLSFLVPATSATVVTVNEPSTATVAPVDTGKVVPLLALDSLAGLAGSTATDQALAKGELETAYANVVFDPTLSDSERAAHLLIVGQEYAKSNHDRAQSCFRVASLIAVLSPDLSDFVRANTILQSGQGLAELGDKNDARFSYQQVRLVAIYSPQLSRPHRISLLDKLAVAYRTLGDDATAKVLADESAGVQSRQLAIADLGGWPLDPLAANPIPPSPAVPEVAEAQQRRFEATQRLQDALAARRDTKEAEGNLSQALLDEDELRRDAFDSQMAGATTAPAKIALLRDRLNWLAIKYRVARKGYGLSLMPAWEKDEATIRADLNAGYQEMFDLYGELVVALPHSEDVNRAWAALYRRQILMGRLGFYPQYPETDLVAKLHQSMTDLIASNTDRHLRVGSRPKEKDYIFFLTTDADFG